ncbi:MAG TPA: hypothetical protein PK400_10360 [Phycisphaerales bacterium]|nr:hypothetical protein [Phycisphaerales bacterium]HRQ76672.1 hypothetical protein [Phycisphaerales bacterium]
MLLIIGIVAFFFLLGALYVIITLMTVPGLAEERLGRWEEFTDLDAWRDDEESNEGKAALKEGLRRQVRLWADPARDMFGRERILRQVRYIDATTGEPVRAEHDQRVFRRRIKPN